MLIARQRLSEGILEEYATIKAIYCEATDVISVLWSDPRLHNEKPTIIQTATVEPMVSVALPQHEQHPFGPLI
jgi:hypothetical protein